MKKLLHFIIPKLFLAVALVLLFIIAKAALKEVERGRRIREEIAQLRVDAEKTRRENSLLEEKIQYFRTEDFQSLEARDKLNYQKEGEQAVVIGGLRTKNSQSESDSRIDRSPDIPENILPNYEKWWRSFFKS